MLLDIEGTALDLKELLRPLTTGRSLRSSEQGLLAAPRSSLKTKGDCVYAAVTPRPWNNPHNVSKKPNHLLKNLKTICFLWLSLDFMTFIYCLLLSVIFFLLSPGSLRAEGCRHTARWWHWGTCWRWSVLWGLGRSAPGSGPGSSYPHTPPSPGPTQEPAAGCLTAPTHTDRTTRLWGRRWWWER